jgi:hypothetical protein
MSRPHLLAADHGPPDAPRHAPDRPPALAALAGDTPVLIRRLDDEFWSGPLRNYEHHHGDRVPALDPRQKVSAWAVVAAALYFPGEPPLVRLTTQSGRQLIITADAGLVTIGHDAELQPIAPRDVVVGRTRLPVVRPVLLAGPAAPLDRDRGRLAGLYISEGHCPPAQPGNVKISVVDDGRARQVLDLLVRLGQRPYRIRREAVGFTGHATCRWLLDRFGHLAHLKSVPAWALGQGRPFLEGLIEGYFGGDGCLWADRNGAVQVAATSVSPAIRDGMVDLLATMDVFCTFYHRPWTDARPTHRAGFGLRVTTRDLLKLGRWFVFDDRERKLRGLLRASYRASAYDQVPVSRSGRKHLYAEFAVRPGPYLYESVGNGAVFKGRIRDCLGSYGTWGRSDVSWDPVMAADPAPPEPMLYGLAVDGPWLFAAAHGLLLQDGRMPAAATPSGLL